MLQFDEDDGELGELAARQRLHGKKARAAAQTVRLTGTRQSLRASEMLSKARRSFR
jgi:hypothetical protein